jgi:hypothetical protein
MLRKSGRQHQSAAGVRTLMTNNGIPNCAQGTWSAQPDYTVTLNNPAVVEYCGNDGETRSLLFTSTNLWGSDQPNSIPFFRAQCS